MARIRKCRRVGCDNPVPQSEGRGRPQKYCRHACKIAAFRRRHSHRGVQQQARKARIAKAAAARTEREGRAPASTPIAWHVCDIQNLAELVEAESVDVIVTDPPYERSALSVWRSLATFAAHALRPGGLLVALSGQIALQGVFRELEHGCSDTTLDYRWTLCYNMPGATTRVWSPRTLCHWKPVIVCQRSTGIVPQFLDDLITAPVRAEQDDAHHKWGQQEGGHGRTGSTRGGSR